MIVRILKFFVILLCVSAQSVWAEGDVSEGRKISQQHCSRCHVIGDFNKYGGIGSTPSFQSLANYVADVLFDTRTLNRGYFNKKFMSKMVENFLAEKTDYASGSWATIVSLITLELWHRLFIDN